ncbi:LacI family transcriptional regulator [Tateyamaria omphalii]|uniref:Transcriptional regulator n=1 Tax=Tateyamaria omphalii TaxID=299262 RepID=A0A1P8MRU5_9RHOB|nr:LacI family transcriptional regulator [Tateyamaria omphalii]APX10732.1 transcriptional regulator [Tateyamaria omphalii]
MTKSGTENAPKDIVMAPGERPTLKTIARLSGLAVPTVSRALADAPDIRKDTKERVRTIAQQIGYRPNRAGVRLRTGRTNVISLVMSTEHDAMNNTARLISAVTSALRGTPYHVIITPYFPDEDPMTPIRYIVETGSADGLIINQTEPDDPRVRYMMEQKFPFVAHGRTTLSPEHAYFDYDNTAFGALAVEALAERGRRHVALLAPPQTQTYAQNMIEGARKTAADKGVQFSIVEGATSHSTIAAVEDAITTLFSQAKRPDALIAPSIGGCVTMVSALEQMGLVLEQDFDIAAKEAVSFLRRFRPGILVLEENVDIAGDFLARALMHRISHPDEPPMQKLVHPDANAWKIDR